MFQRSSRKSRYRLFTRSAAVILCAVAASVLLAGCAPAYNARPGGYYGGPPAAGYHRGGRRCYQGCGYVRDINQVWLTNQNHTGAVLGTVIGAVVGGALGNQVGGGSGKTIATIAGAVAGGAAGHAVGTRSGNGQRGWQILVKLNDGRYATVTQSHRPRVRVGDYVMIRNNEVYRY